MSKEKKKMPSIFKMATNFAKDLGKYIKEGAPNVTHKQYVKRLETCNQCPHLDKERMRCTLCGCAVEHKAKWKTTTCPDKPPRWEHLYKPLGTETEKDRSAKKVNEMLHDTLKRGLWDTKDPASVQKILTAISGKKITVVTKKGSNSNGGKKGDK